MRYMVSYHTDIGIKKSTNQDALLIKTADTAYGKIAFAVICDGMGGLSKGEVASREVITAFSDWFSYQFPKLMKTGFTSEKICAEWNGIVISENEKIKKYGAAKGINLGTTMTAFLIMGDNYYVIHVGDCRLYECMDTLCQLTQDQTVVAKEIEKGNLTPIQAQADPRRSVLLQCIGASNEVIPDFFVGRVKKNCVYIMCTDGFRHEISSEELWSCFAPNHYTEDIMEQSQINLVDENKKRGETDNISVLTIKTY